MSSVWEAGSRVHRAHPQCIFRKPARLQKPAAFPSFGVRAKYTSPRRLIDDHRASAAAFQAPYTGHPVSVGCLGPRSSFQDMDCSEGLWLSCAAAFSSGFLHPPFSRSFKIRRDWTKIGGGGAIKATKSSAAARRGRTSSTSTSDLSSRKSRQASSLSKK